MAEQTTNSNLWRHADKFHSQVLLDMRERYSVSDAYYLLLFKVKTIYCHNSSSSRIICHCVF